MPPHTSIRPKKHKPLGVNRRILYGLLLYPATPFTDSVSYDPQTSYFLNHGQPIADVQPSTLKLWPNFIFVRGTNPWTTMSSTIRQCSSPLQFGQALKASLSANIIITLSGMQRLRGSSVRGVDRFLEWELTTKHYAPCLGT